MTIPMRSTLMGLTATLLIAATAMLSAQQPFVFFASVADISGNLITTLTADDVKVVENGAPGKVVKLEPIDWPIRLQLLVDNGVGMNDAHVHLRNGLKALLMAIPEGIEISLVTTAPQPRMVVRPTMDRQALTQGVDHIAPDSGAARFVEALNEAAGRVDKEKGNYFPVVVIIGTTTAEGSQVLERDVTRMLQRFSDRAATVHVVMLNPGGRSAIQVAGANQTVVGIAVSKVTGGRYEAIAASTRLATLLPEIGAQVAESHDRQSHQYRVTFQRPAGATGAVGDIRMSTRPGMTPTLSINGRMP